MHPDQKYVNALAQNDAAMIEEIYQRFAPKILQFVKKNNGTESDARDLFQEGLITIFHQATEKNLVLTCPFDAYLYLICKRKWLNTLKKRYKSDVTIEELSGYEDNKEVSNSLEEREELSLREELFWKKFNELSESCRKLLSLAWSDISMSEVAEKLGITYSYARKQKTLCTQKLMKLVRESPQYLNLSQL